MLAEKGTAEAFYLYADSNVVYQDRQLFVYLW